MHSHYVESIEKVWQLLEEYMAQVLLAPCFPLPPVITAAVGTVFCPNPQWLGNHSQNLISSVPSKYTSVKCNPQTEQNEPEGQQWFSRPTSHYLRSKLLLLSSRQQLI